MVSVSSYYGTTIFRGNISCAPEETCPIDVNEQKARPFLGKCFKQFNNSNKKLKFQVIQNQINMKKQNNKLILLKNDYQTMMSLLNHQQGKTLFDRRNAEELHLELKRAKLVSMEDFPLDVVRLNSTVKVKADEEDELMELTLVTPDKADIKKKKISIMAPIGTALIGFRQGQKVRWSVPAGKKTFTIIEVINESNNKILES
jgi:regulator of nucleoside diphosphate kinase